MASKGKYVETTNGASQENKNNTIWYQKKRAIIENDAINGWSATAFNGI